MPEQLSLNFDAPISDEPDHAIELETLSDAALTQRYQAVIGINPQVRNFDRATILAGLANPTEEIERIRAIDAEYDGIGDVWSRK